MRIDGVFLLVAAALVFLAWFGGQQSTINRMKGSRRFRKRHGMPR